MRRIWPLIILCRHWLSRFCSAARLLTSPSRRCNNSVSSRRTSIPLILDLLSVTCGRSGAHFSGSKCFNPLVLSKTLFTSSRVHATFVSSHNVGDLNRISRQVPSGDFDNSAASAPSPFASHLSLTPGRPSDRKMLSAILACIARSLAVAD